MGVPRVAAFTDTYLPTVNGVTYTVKTWREYYERRGGRMDVVYPDSTDHSPDDGEFPVRSISFPFYEGFRVGMPRLPGAVESADILHAHTPFGVGLGGMRLARRSDAPLVASYHTPISEYATYVSGNGTVERTLQRAAISYERWYLDRTEVVVTPSERTREYVGDVVGVDTPVEVVPNGVDVERFQPGEGERFRERFDLSGTLVGYTGRHGYEKCLRDVLAAARELDVTVVFGGDGPAREELEARADRLDVDARFLGFLDREDLPGFYAALDVFAFPSPVETQGIVALEANACGTPVVAVDSGALSDTIEEGVNGYHYPRGDVTAFRAAIQRAQDDRDRLSQQCLARREEMSVDHAVERLLEVYRDVLQTPASA